MKQFFFHVLRVTLPSSQLAFFLMLVESGTPFYIIGAYFGELLRVEGSSRRTGIILGFAKVTPYRGHKNVFLTDFDVSVFTSHGIGK